MNFSRVRRLTIEEERPGPERASVEELVEAARARVFDASIVAGIEERPQLRGLTFPELVETSRAVASRAGPDNPLLQRCLGRVRLVLGPHAADEDVDRLARRAHAEVFLTNALAFRPHECKKAPLEGPGAALLREPGRPVIVAFAHTTAFPAAFYALAPAMGRTVFVPNSHAPSAAPPLRLRQFWGEEFGTRYLTIADRRMEVVRALLEQGGAVAFGLDQPGSTKGTFFGVPVLTNAIAAYVGSRRGHPIVVVTTWHDEERFGVRASAPLDAAEHASARSLHRALLATVEDALEGDFSRFIGELQLAPDRKERARALNLAHTES